MSKPVPNDPPHPEIENSANHVLGLYAAQRRYLKSKETQYVQDLLAATRDLPANADFSLRVGAEINRAAAAMILEERGGK